MNATLQQQPRILLDTAEELAKRALAALDAAVAVAARPFSTEKVAAAPAVMPADIVTQIVDTLEERGLVVEGGREKLAALLQDPREFGQVALQLASFSRPASGIGMPVATLPSLGGPTTKAANASADTSEEDERREWAELGRQGFT